MSRKNIQLSLFLLAALAMVSTGTPHLAEAALEKKDLTLINKTVFEVVVLKQTKDSLTYERPLPLDLLPYLERTDKYRSLGTAFALGPTEFVTAAHVLDLGTKSQEKDFYIRDLNGTVYAIDKVLKYSDRRDFVVFSVKDRPAGAFLPSNTNPETNDKVYAVGNALGEGIVIRDGLYTSNTPEDLSGEWKWMRFSAAASPGNSGGPLLDMNGSVIGIVLRKSPSENLNIALPIGEVKNAKAGVAVIHRKMKYSLDNMPMTKIDTLQLEVTLPKPYQSLNEELNAVTEQFAGKLLDQLITENRDKIFPNGKESLSLLNTYYHENFPRVISRGADGNWDAQDINTKGLTLEHNGSITIGRMGNSLIMHVKKPDGVPLRTFYNDSKVFMDTLLKGLGITRQVGIDNIKITSLGKANQESTFVDRYKRKWLVKDWVLEYNNTSIVTFTLPVPGGSVIMMSGGPTGFTNGHIMDLKVLADFMYVSYCGSLKEWREYLTMGELLPDVFSTLNIQFDYGKQIAFRSKRIAFSLDRANMNISENSDLHLSFGFFREGSQVVWDLKEVSVGEDINTVTNYKLTRYTKPANELSDKTKSNWKKLVAKDPPYNKAGFIEDNSTKIASVFTGNLPESKMQETSVLYRVQYRKEGTWADKEMLEKLEAFQKNVSIFDDRQAD
jgi:serine protease Do